MQHWIGVLLEIWDSFEDIGLFCGEEEGRKRVSLVLYLSRYDLLTRMLYDSEQRMMYTFIHV